MSDGDRDRLYEHCRIETAKIMGVDPKRLTSTQRMKLDMAVSLRLALDTLQGKVIAGELVDIAALITANDTLSKLLPALALDEPPPQAREDARLKLQRLIEGARAAADHDAAAGICSSCEALKAELAAVRSMLNFARTGNAPLRDPDGPPPDLQPPSPEPPASSPPASPSSPSSVSPWNPPPAPSAPEPYQEGSDSTWRRFVNPDGSISMTPRTGGWPWS
jgi:hypothetical protein